VLVSSVQWVPGAMTTLLDRVDPPASPPAVPDPEGFVDCRGVLHTWDEEDD